MSLPRGTTAQTIKVFFSEGDWKDTKWSELVKGVRGPFILSEMDITEISGSLPTARLVFSAELENKQDDSPRYTTVTPVSRYHIAQSYNRLLRQKFENVYTEQLVASFEVGAQDYYITFMGHAMAYRISHTHGRSISVEVDVAHSASVLSSMDMRWVALATATDGQLNFITGETTLEAALEKSSSEGAAAWKESGKQSLAALAWAAIDLMVEEAAGQFRLNNSPPDNEPAEDYDDKIRRSLHGMFYRFIYVEFPELKRILKKSVPYTKTAWLREDILGQFLSMFAQQMQASSYAWDVIVNLFGEMGFTLRSRVIFTKDEPADAYVPYFDIDDPFFIQEKVKFYTDASSINYTGVSFGSIPVSQFITATQSDGLHFIRNNMTSPTGDMSIYSTQNLLNNDEFKDAIKSAHGEIDCGMGAWPVPLDNTPEEVARLHAQKVIKIIYAPEWIKLFSTAANHHLTVDTSKHNVPEQAAKIIEEIDKYISRPSVQEIHRYPKLVERAEAYKAELKKVVSKEIEPEELQKTHSAFMEYQSEVGALRTLFWMRLNSYMAYNHYLTERFTVTPFSVDMSSLDPHVTVGDAYYVRVFDNKYNHEEGVTLFQGKLHTRNLRIGLSMAKLKYANSFGFSAVIDDEEAFHKSSNNVKYSTEGRRLYSLRRIHSEGRMLP